MCQDKYNTKKEKYKHINYVERMQIERWHNKDKKSKAEIAKLINKDERTIRREINRGLTRIKDSLWRDIEVDISRKKHNYNIKGHVPSYQGPGPEGLPRSTTDHLIINLGDVSKSYSSKTTEMIPDVPDNDGNYWCYTAVPEDRCKWWENLPTR